MNLLIVHDYLGVKGGAERNIIDSALGLKLKGHNVYLCYLSKLDKSLDEMERAFTETFDINKNKIGRIDNIVSYCKADVVYLHKISNMKLFANLLSLSIPIVRMIHDHDIYCNRNYKYFPIGRLLCTYPPGIGCVFPCFSFIKRNRQSLIPVRFDFFNQRNLDIKYTKQCSKLIVATKYMKNNIAQLNVNLKKINVIPPIPFCDNEVNNEPIGDKKVPIILFVGQIIRGKGVDCLIRSLQYICSDYECIVVGDGTHLEYCKNLSKKLKLTDKVKFTGWLNQGKLREFYSKAQILAVPSVWPEPMGLIGIEAMRHSLPVVAFDAGGISDWLKDGKNGFLIKRKNIKGFADKLQYLLNNPAIALEFGLFGNELVKTVFDFSKYIDQLETTLFSE